MRIIPRHSLRQYTYIELARELNATSGWLLESVSVYGSSRPNVRFSNVVFIYLSNRKGIRWRHKKSLILLVLLRIFLLILFIKTTIKKKKSAFAYTLIHVLVSNLYSYDNSRLKTFLCYKRVFKFLFGFLSLRIL